MKKWSKRFLLPLFLLVFFLFQSQDAGQLESQLTSLSLSIRSELSNLKTQTALLKLELSSTTESLREQSEDLKLSESEREALLIQRNGLISSMENMNEQYGSLYETCVRLEEQLNREKRINTILFWILIGMAALKVVRILVGLKWPIVNKVIPQWVDIVI